MMKVPKWAWWALGVFAAVMIFRDPSGSGHFVNQVARAVAAFIGSI
jgi:hypothetical protein